MAVIPAAFGSSLPIVPATSSDLFPLPSPLPAKAVDKTPVTKKDARCGTWLKFMFNIDVRVAIMFALRLQDAW
ncbi:hypothetical protein Tco_0389473 [Tanacetum coccineum]